MPESFRLERQFAGVTYPTVEALARHAEQLSREISAIPVAGRKPVLFPISTFTQQVAEIAPRHQTYRGRQYAAKAIAAELLTGEGITNPTKTQIAKVKRSLNTLRKSGIIARSELKRKLPLREPTPKLKSRFAYLIEKQVHYNRGWTNLLGDRLKEIARDSLVESIRHAPSLEKSAFEYFSNMVIKRRIIDAVRSVRGGGKQKRAFVQFEEQGGEHSKADVGSPGLKEKYLREEFDTLHSMHKAGEVKSSHLMVWTLKTVLGHRQNRIANHFKVTECMVSKILRSLRDKLAKAE